jgi:hypothetical protein
MIKTQHINALCWIMKPGFGSECLHLGQSEEHVRKFVGTPESITRKYKGQYFYNYPGLGLEVDFGERGGDAAYLFFFRQGFRGNRQGSMKTVHGISPGDKREKVLKLLGPPTSEGESVALNMGGSLDAWFQYDIGINFQFGPDDVINMITIAKSLR